MKREPMWRRYLRFWGPSAERDVDEEFGFHLETKVDELRARGFSRQEARREALRQFGPISRTRAECIAVSRTIERRTSGMEYLSGWWGDVRYAVRVLGKAKASTAAALAVLAISIGATTAVFTILDRMIYEPLPVMNARRLALVSEWMIGPDGRHDGGETFSVGAYDYLRDRNGAFSGLAAEARLVAREHHRHQRIDKPAEASLVSWNYFEVLGVRPIAGRSFAAADDRPAAPRVAIAGYRFAARRYELPRDAVGQTVFLRDVQFVIAGVLPPGFYGLQKGSDPDLYVPLASGPELFPDADFNRGFWLKLFGRLRPGVNIAQSPSNLQVLWEQWLRGGPPEVQKGSKIECVTGERGYAGTSDQHQRSLKLLGAIVGLLLLIGCANIACLLVARGAARQQETAIRLALGSGAARIVRQALMENCLLALAGGVGALLVARWGCRLLLAAFHWQTRPIDIAPDGRVLAFALAVSLLSAALFGLAPTLQLLRGGRQSPTRAETVTSFFSGRVLVTVEVALSLVLLAGAAVFVRSLQNLRALPTGFVADGVSVVRLIPTADDEDGKPPVAEAYTLAGALRDLPVVRSAALVNFVVFNDGRVSVGVRALDSGKTSGANMLKVSSGYWQTLQISLLAGRVLEPREDQEAPRVMVIGQSLAEDLFPGESPLGKRIAIGRPDPERKDDGFEVVGVVKDTKVWSLTKPAPHMLYLPLRLGGTNTRGVALEIRSPLEPAAIGAIVRGRIHDAHLPMTVESVTTLNEEVGASLADDYVRMRASSLFGVLALVLIAVGLYGLMAYTVALRTREIGIRTAVGARTLTIMVLVLHQSLRLVSIGILIGIPATVAVMRALAGIAFGLPPVDWVSVGTAAALLVAAGIAASLAPAWRAAHLDPMQALRVQ